MPEHVWVPPLEYIMYRRAPVEEITNWCDSVFGSGKTKIFIFAAGNSWFCRIYSSDIAKRMQFKLRWSEYIEREYQSW